MLESNAHMFPARAGLSIKVSDEKGTTMDRNDFITLELKPVLGDYADDFDVEGIFEEVAEYDGHGFTWKPEYVDTDALNDVLERFDRS